MEKTIGLMKKVVERVQRENEELKKAPGIIYADKLANLEQENEYLKVMYSLLEVILFGLLILKLNV